MEQDKMRDEALEKIAAKWRDAAALGCVDALECALREAWQASREAVVVELPPQPDADTFTRTQSAYWQGIYKARSAIHAAGIRTR